MEILNKKIIFFGFLLFSSHKITLQASPKSAKASTQRLLTSEIRDTNHSLDRMNLRIEQETRYVQVIKNILGVSNDTDEPAGFPLSLELKKSKLTLKLLQSSKEYFLLIKEIDIKNQTLQNKKKQFCAQTIEEIKRLHEEAIRIIIKQKTLLLPPCPLEETFLIDFKKTLERRINNLNQEIEGFNFIVNQALIYQSILQDAERNQELEIKLAKEKREKKQLEDKLKKVKKLQRHRTAQRASSQELKNIENMLKAQALFTENPLATQTEDLKRTLELKADEKARKDAEFEKDNRLLAQQAKIVSSAHPHALHQLDLQHQQEQPAAPAAPIAAPYSIHARGSFITWLDTLSPEAQKTINERIERMTRNDFGDAHKIANTQSLWELRIRRGHQAYRLYYTQEEENKITLLWGGNKKTQDQDIEIAKKYVKSL